MATALANVISLDEIELTVLPNMRLAIYPQEIARAGEHNSAVFRIVSQPVQLDGLPCRAEILTADGAKFHVLVQGGTFRLTNDITKHGVGTIQLVYSDATVSHKTQQAQYWVAPSVDAIDPSAPDHVDGLAQLSNAAFAQAGTLGTVLAFANIYGREVARVTFPGAGIDEATADMLYLRLNGSNQMQSSLFIAGSARGVVFNTPVNGGAIYSDQALLVIRRPVGNAEVLIENQDGVAASRTPIVTQLTGDARYAQITYVNSRFIPVDGGVMTGPIVTTYDSMSPAVSQLITRAFADARFVSLDGGSIAGPLTAIYDASDPAPSNLIARSFADATFLKLSGGQVSGILFMGANQPFVSAMGSGNNPMLCVGSNDSGWWRSASNVVFEVGRQVVAIYSATVATYYAPIALAVAPTLANHAVPKGYVDALVPAPSMSVGISTGMTLTTAFQTIVSLPYNIPRGGNSRVQVTVGGGLRYPTQAALGMVQVRATPGDIVRNVFAYSVPQLEGSGNETSGFTLTFFVDVTGTNPVVGADIRSPGGATGLELIGGTAEPQRTTVTFVDLGAR